MKKILITIGVLLILATGAAIFIEEYQVKDQVLLDNPIPDNMTTEEEKDTKENSEELSGSWMWQSSTNVDGEVVEVNSSEDFVLTISNKDDEWRLNSSTDCNNVAGSFIKNDEVISVGPLVSTKKACLEETQEEFYSEQLSFASSYSIEGDILTIILVKDSGTMIFVRKE